MGTYAKLKLLLLAVLMMSIGCTQSFEGLGNKVIKPVEENIKLETKPDGTGSELSSTQLLLNDSLTFYPIKRDKNGNYVDNISVSWAVEGGVGSLTIDPSGKFATLLGSTKGTATVKIYIDDVLYSTTSVEVVATQLNLSNFQISNVTTTSFDVSVDYTGDDEENSAVSLKYCSEDVSPGCDPESGTEVVLTRGASSWTGSATGLDVAETYNLAIVAEDPDGALGLPLTAQQRLLGNAITISNLVLSNVTTSGFDVSVDFTGDSEANSDLTLYYCNRTSNSSCDPTSGDSLVMTRGASAFTASVTALSGPSYNAGDLVAIEVVADDFDGVSGSPLTASDNLADLRLTNFSVTNQVKDGFYAKVDFEEAVGTNATVNLYYCNETDSPGCDPLSGASTAMTKNGSIFEVTVTGLTSPFDEGDQVNALAVGADPEGVINLEALTETFYLADITLFDLEYGYLTNDGFIIEINKGYSDSNNNSTATAYYCNETTNPGCDPKTGVSELICSGSCNYIHEFTSVSSTVGPGEVLKLLVEFVDPDGIYKDGTGGGSPAQYSLSLNMPNPKDIYRSVGPGQTSYLVDGAAFMPSINLTISSGAATFSAGLLDEVGVGDAIYYDSNNDGTMDALAFIHSRTDNQNYTLRNKDGDLPLDAVSHSAWRLYRAYVSAADAENGDENPGIVADTDLPSGLINFDSWTGGLDISAQTGLDLNWYVALYAGTQPDSEFIEVSGWKKEIEQDLQFFVPYKANHVGVSQRHNGVWDDTKYRLVVTDSSGITVSWVQRVDIIGLQVEIAGSTSASGITLRNNHLAYVGENIVRSTSTARCNGLVNYSYGGASSDSNYFYADKSWSIFANNIVYDFSATSSKGFAVDWQSGNGDGARLYNNTFYNNYFGIFSESYRSSIIRNNIVMNSIHADFNSAEKSSSVHTTQNNISSDATISNYNTSVSSGNVTNADPADIFVDHLNDDFRLKSGSIAIGQGYDLSSTVPTDIQGDARTVPFDVGADEF